MSGHNKINHLVLQLLNADMLCFVLAKHLNLGLVCQKDFVPEVRCYSDVFFTMFCCFFTLFL